MSSTSALICSVSSGSSGSSESSPSVPEPMEHPVPSIDQKPLMPTKFNNLFKKVLSEYIHADFNIDGDAFIEQMIKCKLFITGGIIPAVINHNKEYGDIDIICCADGDIKGMKEYIEKTLNIKSESGGYKYFGTKHIQLAYKLSDTGIVLPPKESKEYVKYSHPYFLESFVNKDLIYKLRGLSLIDIVIDYVFGNKCMQLIHIKTNDIQEYIRSFDLDICRNYFNGEILYCEELSHITSKRMILYRYKNQEGQIVDSLLNERTTDRVEKYKKRGYKLKKEIYIYLD